MMTSFSLLCIVTLGHASGLSTPLFSQETLANKRLLNPATPLISMSVIRQRSAHSAHAPQVTLRGGSAPTKTASTSALSKSSSSSSESENKCPVLKTTRFVSSLWGAIGVALILLKSVKRVMPIALEPFVGEGVVPLSSFQLGAYVITCLYFAYAEGYKGFQKKFSPMVVARAFTIKPRWRNIHHIILAPMYSMGLFHATKKRMIISWGVTIGVGGIVALVKKLPYPWRNIVDAGVVVGLTWGSLSIIFEYFKALFTGKFPEGVDPALPE